MRVRFAWPMVLGLVLFGAGCDDGGDTSESPDMAAAGGMGGMGGAGGGGGAPADDGQAYVVTELDIDVPAGPVGVLLRNLINQNINDEAIIIMARFSSGTPYTVAEAGAAQYLSGQDTEAFDDDVFTWETAGTCIDPDGSQFQCSVDVSNAPIVFTGDDFLIERTTLDIYSSDLAAIIRLKDVRIEGAVGASGAEMAAALAGVITQPDAETTRFELPPGSGTYTTLDAVLAGANIEPTGSYTDGEGNMVPAYDLAGSIVGSAVQFSAQ
ncbi:MAG: hypothetical protein KC613_07335 [Myxococcales bacterium]|nr:hypothetical protein [Myxococcales bacterium]MCB9521987.1 hypothetical protein [Myxococcales bacterium]